MFTIPGSPAATGTSSNATEVSKCLQEGTKLLIMGQNPFVFKRMAGSQHSHSLERDTFLCVSQDH